MKNRLTHTLAGFFALVALSLASCEKDEDRVSLTPDTTPILTTSTNTVTLAQGNNRRTAVTFSWTPITAFSWSGAENSYNPAVTYSIELDQQGDNFASPVSIDAGAGPNTALTVGSLNVQLNNLGLTAGTPTAIEARLKSTYANNAPIYSPIVALTATSFECKAPTADTWAIIGDAGVNWDTDVQMSYDCDENAYTLTRDLKADVFKFRSNKSWTVNYGDNGADGTLELEGANISVPSAGNYTIIFSPSAKTYTLQKN